VLALVDESYRAASPGLFVLAAVAVEQDADLDALRHVVRPFAYSHACKTEPLLWLPDAVAGAAAHDLSSTRTDYLALLPNLRLAAAEGVA